MQELGNLIDEIAKDHPWWIDHYSAIAANVNRFESQGILRSLDYVDCDVMDFGGSAGQIAVNLLAKGARRCVVIDTHLPVWIYASLLNNIPGLEHSTQSVEDYSMDEGNRFDLVIAHTVTEHVYDLPSALTAIRKCLRPGGYFVAIHDSYYHPSGAHDNYLLEPNERGAYEYRGPKCWTSETRCADTLSLRTRIMTTLPWAWSAASEASLNPSNCSKCAFFKRTHPWAHLLWQDQFNDVFPGPGYQTGRPGSFLNKVTPFQLRQYLIEAGFVIADWQTAYVSNEPPEELMKPPFYLSKEELTAVNILIRARAP